MIQEEEPECWRCEPLAMKTNCMMQQHLNQMISVDSKGQKPLLRDRRNPFDQLQIEIMRITKENPDRIRLIKNLTEEVNTSPFIGRKPISVVRSISRSTGVNGSNASHSIRSTTHIHCRDRMGTQLTMEPVPVI
jgi:hypothetical protein